MTTAGEREASAARNARSITIGTCSAVETSAM